MVYRRDYFEISIKSCVFLVLYSGPSQMTNYISVVTYIVIDATRAWQISKVTYIQHATGAASFSLLSDDIRGRKSARILSEIRPEQ